MPDTTRDGPTGEEHRRARRRRRLEYVPRTLRAVLTSRPGRPPDDDQGWAGLLRVWIVRNTEALAADAMADLAGRTVPEPTIVGRARRVWSLAHVARRGLDVAGLDVALDTSIRGLELMEDPEQGGYHWAVGRDGRPIGDWKLLYGQSVAAYAWAEVALARPDQRAEALAKAEAVLELATRRRTGVGTVPEFVDRRWAPLPAGARTEVGAAGTVTLGGQLHLLEAAALVVAAGGGDGPRNTVAETMGLLHDHFPARDGRPSVTTIDEGGRPLPSPPTLGHEIEAAWLHADAASVLGLDAAGQRAAATRRIENAIRLGFRHGSQGDLPDTGFRLGGQQRSWWVQAELLRALVEVDDGPSSPRRQIMGELLRWLHRRQVDPRTGQARKLVTHWGLVLRTGATDSTRTGYHDIRAYAAAADLLTSPDG